MTAATVTRPLADDVTRWWVSVGHPSSPSLEVAHSTASCPTAGEIGAWFAAGDEDGWVCETCVEVRRGNFAAAMEEARTLPTGSGSGRAAETGPAVVTWTKHQDAWLLRVPASLGVAEGATVTVHKASGETVEAVLGRRVATNRGDALHEASRPGQAAAAGSHRPNKFAGACAECGQEVPEGAGRIDKENGRWIVRHVGACPAPSPAPAAASSPAPVSTGSMSMTRAVLSIRDRLVALTGAQTRDRSIRVAVPGSVLDVDQSEAAYRIGWGYETKGAERHTGGVGDVRSIPLGSASVVKLAEYLLGLGDDEFLAAQAAYGRHFHTCGRCGSPLSDDESKRRGLGPDCASKRPGELWVVGPGIGTLSLPVDTVVTIR